MPGLGFICAACVSTSIFSIFASGQVSVVGPHLSLATSEGDIDESSGVLEALESTALGDLGLLLGLNLCVTEKTYCQSSVLRDR